MNCPHAILQRRGNPLRRLGVAGCTVLALAWVVFAGTAMATERRFDFSGVPTNQPPPGCFSTIAGTGKPGNWKVIMDDVPLGTADATTNKAVVAQLAWDTTDEHYPLLILGENTYNDFTLTTRFKTVDGLAEQMAGVAFRIQDEKNFYVARASSIGNSIYVYKFEKGIRDQKVHAASATIGKGVWHELTVACEGTTIKVLLDGTLAMPPFSDDSFAGGKVGYWTKSDSISYFADTRISYVGREPFTKQLVQDTMREFPRLVSLKLFMVPTNSVEPRLIASSDEKGLGEAGGKADADVIKRGVNYYDKKKDVVIVTMPLNDRNGDPVAAVRITMKTFAGQTEENALVRATPIIKTMQLRASSVRSLTE
ncbi:MAG: hypothetical protein JWR26_4424 [Pedosphaera sp.]|nr:hypothetical protein [Pedosphaera sp.]